MTLRMVPIPRTILTSGYNRHRIEGGDSQSPVPIPGLREFLQDVMWGSRVELPDASD